ncbi:MAG: Lytic transglycosylase catalytic [Phenylobacterium sp.]|nr:Lytic transglycosylase catalytic [Phenylobacterium sp.]
MQAPSHPTQGDPRPWVREGQGGSTPWSREGGAVAGPRRPSGVCLLGVALAALALSASAACAQVFEVSDGALRRVDARRPPAPAAHRGLTAEVKAAAARYGLAPELLDVVARQESGYRVRAVSAAGAVGVMQLMPATARALGVDPRNPIDNLNAGAAYLKAQLVRFGGRIDLALAAYNAGPEAVRRHGGVPPYRETRAYVATSLQRLAEASLAAPSTLQSAGLP